MPESLLILAVFLVAGAAKGVIALDLPTVALGLQTASIRLETAMALMLAPSFVTDLWQGLVGEHAVVVVRRTWPFLLLATARSGTGSRCRAAGRAMCSPGLWARC